MKKLLALFLCLIMFLSVFVGCSNNEKENETGGSFSSDTGNEDGELTDGIPDGVYDFGGRDFVITTPWPDYWGINNYDVEELSNDTVYDEVYYRNRKIEKRFNVKISTIELGTTDDCVETLSPYITSDAGVFDLICFAYSTGSYGLISSGLLATWNDVPVINYEKPWWNKSAVESGTINGNIYFNAGSFNWFTTAHTYAIFFNDMLRQSYGIDDLYTTVLNGEWTLDKVQEYSRLVAKENGDGTWNDKDQYGIVIDQPVIADVMAVGCGFETVTKDGDSFTINVGNATHQKILNKLYDIFARSNHLAFSRSTHEMFANDQALFYCHILYNTTYFRSMESDFGIIPLPKLDENQENYCSYADSWGLANAMPICTDPGDFEMFGVLLEALACESYNKLYPAYYEYTLKGRDTRDTESWQMLDILTSTLVYDFGIFYLDGGSMSNTLFAFQKLLNYGREKTDLASYKATYIDQWESHYQEVMEFGLDD